MKRKKETPTLCLVSSSGGHWEQLQKLKPLIEKYDGFLVTEKTQFKADAKYLMMQTDLKDKLMIPKMIVNSFRALKIWIKERPNFVVTKRNNGCLSFFSTCRGYTQKICFY